MKRKFFILVCKLLLILAIFVFAVWLSRVAEQNEFVRYATVRYGYVAIFAISVLSGINIIVPIPAVAFLPLFIESGLGIWPTILVIAFGVTLGDAIGFLLGKTGHQLVALEGSRAVAGLVRLRDKYHWFPLVALFFYAALAPLPNEFIIIPLGFLGYRITKILPIAFAGNALFAVLTAFGVLAIF